MAQLDGVWKIHVDNRFASRVFSSVGTEEYVAALEYKETQLCRNCKDLRVWEAGFSVQYEPSALRISAVSCDLCGLFWKTCVKWKATEGKVVGFVREQSWLKLNEAGPPVLSLCRHPDLSAPTDLQIGLPVLPEPNSAAHFEILRQWLDTCDKHHSHAPFPSENPKSLVNNHQLPTRLLDVGREGDDFIRILRTDSAGYKPGSYVALSHPWGEGPHFCTFRGNLSKYEAGIPLGELPGTFHDAVIATRALKVPYLWIDSICIIQGVDGEFKEEAKRMEHVFSAARCVIAASSASGQADGFLHKTWAEDRTFVPLHWLGKEKPSIFVCETLDDFNHHVLESPLSRRGWVLQERALARRTIFFTAHQTYWECGNGVACTTMTWMTNSLAALLGDTAFPQIMMNARKGERILRYQDFFKNYSRLALTQDYDRPIAIAGLQNRLLEAFNTEGGFGIFDEGPHGGHLRRSLLWHRASDVHALKRISFPPGHDGVEAPPSWSWMAYTGGIDYLNLEFDGFDWEELQSPWSRPGWPVPTERLPTGGLTLGAKTQSFDYNLGVGEGRGELTWDDPSFMGIDEQRMLGNLRCVILGRSNSRARNSPRNTCYVLIILPDEDPTQHPGYVWRRVGAGYLPGACIFSTAIYVLIR